MRRLEQEQYDRVCLLTALVVVVAALDLRTASNYAIGQVLWPAILLFALLARVVGSFALAGHTDRIATDLAGPGFPALRRVSPPALVAVGVIAVAGFLIWRG